MTVFDRLGNITKAEEWLYLSILVIPCKKTRLVFLHFCIEYYIIYDE